MGNTARTVGYAAPSRRGSGAAEQIAHVLRRCTFGPLPGKVDEALGQGSSAADLAAELLAARPIPFRPPADIDRPFDPAAESELGASVLIGHWLDRMVDDRAGLHERMMWFWHTHFTSSLEKCTFLLVWRQLRTLHTHALGNFAELTKALSIDAAMLQYLDGSGSNFRSPNENFGRELLELYTMGRGNYTEDDVRAAAKAFSGWDANRDGADVLFRSSDGPTGPITFLGRTAAFDASSAVDQVMSMPVVALFICRKLWASFVGGPADEAVIASWADEFRSSGYEIRPLVETIVSSRSFAEARYRRARSGLEWFCAVRSVLALGDIAIGELAALGQVPYYPPNVAGWPNNWTSSSSHFARFAFLTSTLDAVDVEKLRVGSVDDALERASLYEISNETRHALDAVARSTDGPARGRRILRAVLMSPEFAVA